MVALATVFVMHFTWLKGVQLITVRLAMTHNVSQVHMNTSLDNANASAFFAINNGSVAL